jgi:hypothetical protein
MIQILPQFNQNILLPNAILIRFHYYLMQNVIKFIIHVWLQYSIFKLKRGMNHEQGNRKTGTRIIKTVGRVSGRARCADGEQL